MSSRSPVAIAATVTALFLVLSGMLVLSVWRDLDAVPVAATPKQPARWVNASVTEESGPQYETLAIGGTLEWVAEKFPSDVVRQAGPFIITITKEQDGDLVAPVVKVASGSQSVTMKGSAISPSHAHQVSFIQNRTQAGPAVMLQSFSGGAHCCNSIQVAGFVREKLKILDLGSWDGEAIDPPKDISGDGVVDFVMYDNGFLYAFASYADSYAPPKILNIVGGEVRDVSRNPAFRSLFRKGMQDAAQRCRPGLGAAANGACPAFVAAAARVGKLGEAWAQMLAAYDASADWDLPSGCAVSAADACPDEAQIVYKSYPEALLAFLKREGYVPENWLPPEARQRSIESPPSVSDDWTA